MNPNDAPGGGGGGGAAPADPAANPAAGGAAPASGGAPVASEKPFYDGWKLDAAAQDFVTGKGFKSPEDLVKSALTADKMARDRNVIAAPDLKDLTNWEGWDKLGWTREIADYKVPEAKPPGGLAYDKGIESEFVKLAHEARVPVSQATALRDGLLGLMAKQVEAQTAAGARAQSELQAALKAEWGRDFDAKRDLAARAAKALGVDLVTSAQLESFTGAPGLLKLFAKVGESLSEDTLRGGDAGRNAMGMSPEAASAEQRRLESDPDFMRSLTDPRHPQHQDNAARRQRLIEIKVGAQR